jgi:hypothetical protein
MARVCRSTGIDTEGLGHPSARTDQEEEERVIPTGASGLAVRSVEERR